MARKKLTTEDKRRIQNRLNDAWKASASSFLVKRGRNDKKPEEVVYSKRGFRLTKNQLRQRRKAELKKKRHERMMARQTRPHKKLRKPRYQEYINSPAWRRRCKDFYSKYGKACAACGETRRIHMHHMSYRHLGNEADHELTPLCRECHETYHRTYGTHLDMISTTTAFIAERRLST
jgi:hypothetical protein